MNKCVLSVGVTIEYVKACEGIEKIKELSGFEDFKSNGAIVVKNNGNVIVNGYEVSDDDYIMNISGKTLIAVNEHSFKAITSDATDFVSRMKNEMDDLADKMEKLSKFVHSKELTKNVPKNKINALLVQLPAMTSYYKIVAMRLFKELHEEDRPISLGFSEALYAMRQFLCARRSSWKEGVYVTRQIPASINKDIVPKMQSLPDQMKEMILNNTGTINYTNQLLIVDTITGKADSYTPSSDDVLSEDWEIKFE